MKIIIIQNVYPKLGIINGSIRYIKNTSFTEPKWIQKDVTMHPPINVLVNFNNFIKKNIKLQVLLKNVVLIMYPYQGISNIIITYWNQTPPKHS